MREAGNEAAGRGRSQRKTDRTLFEVVGCNGKLGHGGEDVSLDSVLKNGAINDTALQLIVNGIQAVDSKPSEAHIARQLTAGYARRYDKESQPWLQEFSGRCSSAPHS